MAAKHNFYILDDVLYLELKGRAKGTYAMISPDKWHLVSKYDWYLSKSGYPTSYQPKINLHRLIYTAIFGQYPPSEMHVDHIDRNKLNNTNQNLRLVTPQENSFNKSTKTNKKGVRKISENNYSSVVVKDGIKHEIKNIKSAEEAAEIYNMMSEELFGVFSAPNNV